MTDIVIMLLFQSIMCLFTGLFVWYVLQTTHLINILRGNQGKSSPDKQTLLQIPELSRLYAERRRMMVLSLCLNACAL